MTDQTTFQLLKQFGLHDSEVRAYLALLADGAATPPELSRRTGIARANSYHVLAQLADKHLVREERRGKRKCYIARDPQALSRMLERQKEIFDALLPELRTLSARRGNKPHIRFFDGIEEIHELYLETLTAVEIRGLGSTKILADTDASFYERYLSLLRTRKIIFYDIQTHPSREQGVPQMKEALGGLYAVKFLPSRARDVSTDMLFWGDNVASVVWEEPIFGMVITSPHLARAYRTFFDVLWERL